ncbi:MAG: hypothetical protein WC867_05870 [Candidatus Pacearchaeota archaeon]|jgi:tetratricopeptide (TPR) repeat protein
MEYEKLVELESNYILALARDVEESSYMNDMQEVNKSLKAIINDATSKKNTKYPGTVFLAYPVDYYDSRINEDIDFKREVITFSLEDLLLNKTPDELMQHLQDIPAVDEKTPFELRYCVILSGETFIDFILDRNNSGKLSESEKLHNFGVSYFRNGDYLEAVDALNLSIEKNPDFSLPYLNKSVVFRNMGLYQTSLDLSKKALELAPRNKKAWYEIGVVSLFLDNKEQALLALNRAFAIDPEYEPVKTLLEKLSNNELSI